VAVCEQHLAVAFVQSVGLWGCDSACGKWGGQSCGKNNIFHQLTPKSDQQGIYLFAREQAD
jgi:hypothetical protein